MNVVHYDDNPKTLLVERVNAAVDKFIAKYGRLPKFCRVNPVEYSQSSTVQPAKAPKLVIIPSRAIQPNYIWVGME